MLIGKESRPRLVTLACTYRWSCRESKPTLYQAVCLPNCQFALADLGLTAADFHAVFDGALRAPAGSASRSH
jgi:hypothetical protein